MCVPETCDVRITVVTILNEIGCVCCLRKFELSSEPMLRREDPDAGGADERALALHTMCCGVREE